MTAPTATRDPFPVGLYPILDPDVAPSDQLLDRVPELCQLGVGALQVRVKTGGVERVEHFVREVMRQCRSWNIAVIVNDHLEVALTTGARGVHLGQCDVSVAAARSLLGDAAWIGLSTHNIEEIDEVNRRAGTARPDYIGFGPLYETSHREMAHEAHGMSGLKEATGISQYPVIAIGGIRTSHVDPLCASSVHGFAVIGSISGERREFDRFLRACSKRSEYRLGGPS